MGRARLRPLTDREPTKPTRYPSRVQESPHTGLLRRPGAPDAGVLAPGRHLREVAPPERRQAALVVPGRPHHRQQPDGRPPRLGPRAQGLLPALPRHARPGAALPERIRLPGPLGRGRGGEGAGLPHQARHRGVRPGRFRREVQGARAQVLRPPDGAVHPPRLLDGLGQLLLHDVGREQLHHLDLPEALPRARARLHRPGQHALVRALRHGHQPARDARGLQGGRR